MRRYQFYSTIDFKDIFQVSGNVYYQPISKIAETIDSFAILPLSVFISGADGWCLVTIQSTIATRHKANGTVLRRLYHHIKGKLGMDIPHFHIFVTSLSGDGGIRTYQKYTQDNGNYYVHEPDIPQYAMLFRDEFQQLMDQFSHQ